MNDSHQPSLKDLLIARGMKNRDLATTTGLTESRVSDIGRGLIPGKDTQRRITEALALTDEEIASLGWEQEAARA